MDKEDTDKSIVGDQPITLHGFQTTPLVAGVRGQALTFPGVQGQHGSIASDLPDSNLRYVN